MEIFVPKYNNGFHFVWEPESVIKCELRENYILLEANRDGLVSLARHLLELADEDVPEYTHLHFDDYGELEPGSTELIVVKRNFTAE